MHRHVYTLTCDMKATRVQFMGDRGGRAAVEDKDRQSTVIVCSELC